MRKPIALTADEGQQLVDAANANPKLKVMEAFMYRHHPQWRRAKQIVDDGGIGQLRTIEALLHSEKAGCWQSIEE